ncbi:MAG: phenylpyruvate tautomerase MIF-related protein [Victivallales bacterium]
MPTVKLTISKKFDRNEKENLALELTALVAKEIGKPETVTQAIVADDAVVSFGGNFLAPSAFIVVMSVGGLNPEVCKRLSAAPAPCWASMESADSAFTSTSRKSEEMNGAGKSDTF